MAQTVPSEEAKKLIDGQINLPTPPAIALKILDTVKNEQSSMEELGNIIGADPALTSKILSVANSVFYSLPHKIGNVQRALSILGTNVIKNISLSFIIADELHGATTPEFNFENFWKRSITCGVAANLLTNHLKIKNEDIFVTALLQDVGILTMYLSLGSEYGRLVQHCLLNTKTELITKEQEIYGFDHQQLSHLLLESWGIPDSIIAPILNHHTPSEASTKEQFIPKILDAAYHFSAIYNSQSSGEFYRQLQQKMKDYFNVDTQETRLLLDDLAQKSIEILKSFDIDNRQIKSYSQILQEANDELGKLNLSYEQLVLELKESKKQSERFADELQKANEKLEDLAFRDGLTHLFNHRYFHEILSNEIARSIRYEHYLSLILFDIDHFKNVNDTYGHPAGDKVLVNLAKTIQKATRPSDILARYGGEEFAVLLPETNHTGMKVFGERLRRCVSMIKTPVGNSNISITISCGGTTFLPGNSVSEEHFFSTADKALYQSKKDGRNRMTSLPL